MEDDAKFLIFGGLAFATGVVVGLGMGLLMAPQSGARTRRQLSTFVDDLREDATHIAEEAKQAVGEAIDGAIERGRRIVK